MRLVKLTGGAVGAGEPEIGPKGSNFEPGSRNSAPRGLNSGPRPDFGPQGAELRLPGSKFEPLGATSGSPEFVKNVFV